MLLKIKNIFLLITIILLQSCSGGKIGNFFETSFNNVEEPKTKEVPKNKLINKPVIESAKSKEENKNPKETEKTKEVLKNKLINKPVIESAKSQEDNKNPKEKKIKEDSQNISQNKITSNTNKKLKKKKKLNAQNISLQKKQYQPRTYKIILIIKDVDPTDPIEDLSSILRNSDVSFEIEKIERFFDSKNKSLKKI